ncbi:MAG: hypothetical protein ACRDWE_02615, partial [Acidimicrobiales bacterium]
MPHVPSGGRRVGIDGTPGGVLGGRGELGCRAHRIAGTSAPERGVQVCRDGLERVAVRRWHP